MADKKGVVMYYDILEQLEDFNDKDFREIINAVINYDKNGIEPNFTGEKKIAFKFIKTFPFASVGKELSLPPIEIPPPITFTGNGYMQFKSFTLYT